MSIFRDVTLGCPACGAEGNFSAVYSVNADRRPDLREAIIDQTFQRRDCDECGKAYRLDPQFVYLDVDRQQWLAVFPASEVGDWERHEKESSAVFAKSFGAEASPEAGEIGAELKPRVVFGWAALREKLLAFDMGLDDVTLELTKLAVMRGLGDFSLDDAIELRLINKAEEGFVFAWLEAATEEIRETLIIPGEIYEQVAAADEVWQPLREDLSGGLFVDTYRLMTETTGE